MASTRHNPRTLVNTQFGPFTTTKATGTNVNPPEGRFILAGTNTPQGVSRKADVG